MNLAALVPVTNPFADVDPNQMDDAKLMRAAAWAQGVVNRSAWRTDTDGWFALATANAILEEQAQRSGAAP